MHGNFSFSRKGFKYRLNGWSNTPHFEIFPIIQSVLFLGTKSIAKINTRHVTRYGKLFDEYYREGIWSVDRYAMALAHFWGALCTQFPDQALLGVTSTLECLLSTKNMEIIHTLAERSALILHNKSSERLKKYNEVKNIYAVRSKLVHGKAFVKKGPINQESLCVSPKYMVVPKSVLSQAFNVAFNILIAIINNKKVMDIIQKRKSEDKITNELDAYYTAALFNAFQL